MIALFTCLGYFATSFLVSRPIYGYLRKSSIEYNTHKYQPLYQYSRWTDGSLEYYGFKQNYWNSHNRPYILFSSVVLSLFWPVIPIGVGAMKYMTGSKIRSTVELEAEKAARARTNFPKSSEDRND